MPNICLERRILIQYIIYISDIRLSATDYRDLQEKHVFFSFFFLSQTIACKHRYACKRSEARLDKRKKVLRKKDARNHVIDQVLRKKEEKKNTTIDQRKQN